MSRSRFVDDPNYYSTHTPHWAPRGDCELYTSETPASGSVSVRGWTQLHAESYARELIDSFVGGRKYTLELHSEANTTDLYADRGSWVTYATWTCI